jgi:uncharacterized protein YbaA (DUF1428 family)
VNPVPAANRDRYIAYARAAWAAFRKQGALRFVEAWGDDVPDGVHTSFTMALKREPGEVVLFSWIEWSDKATRDTCHAGMTSDPDMAILGEMPLAGRRMIWGGRAGDGRAGMRQGAPAAPAPPVLQSAAVSSSTQARPRQGRPQRPRRPWQA